MDLTLLWLITIYFWAGLTIATLLESLIKTCAQMNTVIDAADALTELIFGQPQIPERVPLGSVRMTKLRFIFLVATWPVGLFIMLRKGQ